MVCRMNFEAPVLITSSYEVVRYPPTDEVFFAQSAGPLAAGTGLKKSSLILKISLGEAMAVSSERDAVGKVQVHIVPTEPPVINPNGMSPWSLGSCHTLRSFSTVQCLLTITRRHKLQGHNVVHRRGNGPGYRSSTLCCQSYTAL